MFRREGGKYLETYRTPQMSWEEVKALKGQDTIGLGPTNENELSGLGVGTGGYSSCGNRIGPKKPMLMEDADDVSDDEHTTDKAMLGAAGDEGLTEEEAAGLVMNTSAAHQRRAKRLGEVSQPTARRAEGRGAQTGGESRGRLQVSRGRRRREQAPATDDRSGDVAEGERHPR